MASKARVYGKRALLNRPGHESTAAIVAEVFDDTYGPSFTLQISDCSRVININLGVSDADDYENSLEKLDTMIDALRELKKGVRAMWRIHGE